MNLDTLKERAGSVFILGLILSFLVMLVSTGAASGLAYLIASIAGIALVMWMAATVADAMVKSLKKEK